MNRYYKPSETKHSTFSSQLVETHRNDEFEHLLIQQIENLFLSEKQKNYELMKHNISTLKKVFKKDYKSIYEIIWPYPIMQTLLNAFQIPQIFETSLDCIAYLIPVQPKVYQQQLLQVPEFIQFLFDELKNNRRNSRYVCILTLINLTEAFYPSSQLFIQELDFPSLQSFSLENEQNSQICLKFIRNIVKYIEINNETIKDLIKIAADNFYKFRPENTILLAVMDFYNDLIYYHFLAVTSLISLNLIEHIFNYISEDDLNLTFSGISFYFIVINQGLKDKDYLKIAKQIFSEASISEIINWVTDLSTNITLCQVGYLLLSLLIKNQELIEIDVISHINESSIIGSAVSNIRDCAFFQKLKLLKFIKSYIKKADCVFITNQYNNPMFFSLFENLLNQSFDSKSMAKILKLFLIYLTKFHICRTKEKFEEEMSIISKTYNLIDPLQKMILDDDYNGDDVILGTTRSIMNILSIVNSKNEE